MFSVSIDKASSVEDGRRTEYSLASHWHRIHSNQFEDLRANRGVAPVNLNLGKARHCCGERGAVTNVYKVGFASKTV